MKRNLLSLFIFISTSFLLKAQDTTVTHYAPFHTQNQSLWRQGATGLVNINVPFFDLSWDESGSFGGITHVAGFPFGAEFNAGTWGAMGSGLRIEFGNERVEIDYQADIDLEMPASGTFEKGEEITINTSYDPIDDSCNISPDEYNILFRIWFAMGFGFNIDGEFCFFDCTDATIIDIDMPVDTFDIVYISNTTGISLLDGLYEWPAGDYFPFTWSDSREIIDIMIDLPTNAGAASYLNSSNQLISKIPPYLYASVFLDIPKFIGALNIPYVSAFFANLTNEWELGPITIGYSLMNTGFLIGLYHNQTLTFTPQIKTTLAFPGNIDYKVLTPTNSVVVSGTNSTVTLDVGNKLRFNYPCNYDFMDIDPYYYMRNNFNNKTYDSIAFDFLFEMLEFHISMDDIEVIPRICIPIYVPCGPWYCVVCDWCHDGDICTPAVVFHGFDYSFGPLVHLQPNIANVKYNWVNNNWEMLGFNSVDPPTFRIRPAKYFVVANPTDAPCFGVNGGSATAVVAHGTPPYRYEWSNGTVNYSSLTSNSVINLPAGTHYVIVTDANNCVTFSSFEIGQPAAALAITDSITNVDCNGANTGLIDISTTGGTTPYSWNWSNGASTEDNNNVIAGNYHLTITDAHGCILSNSFSVTEPYELIVVADSTNVMCNGNNSGSASVVASGGTPPYSYSWTGGSTASSISNITAGIYSVTVTDFNLCQKIVNFNIEEPLSPLALTATTLDAFCNGESSGQIQINALGGSAPYQYKWYQGTQIINHSMSNLDSIPSGQYTVVVTDAHGCTHDTIIIIDQPAAIATSVATVDNLCFGETNGIVTLSVNGGTGPFVFNWSNGASTQDLSMLAAGTYSVTITDNNGCSRVTEAIITEPGAPLTASVEPIHIRCFGDASGSALSTVQGGTPPYTYLWSNGQTSNDANYIPTGTYTVTITDNNGCHAYSGTIVNQPADSLFFVATTIQPSCYGYSDGSISIIASGGTTPYYLRWDDMDLLLQQNSHIVEQLESGYYQVIVTDFNGCKSERNILVDQPDTLTVLNSINITNCFGGNDGAIDISVSGGTNPYTYSWSNGSTNADASGLESGQYYVTITDDHGCPKTETYFVGSMSQITISSLVVPVSCSDNTDGSILLNVDGGAGNYSYLWSNGLTLNQISELGPGNYSVLVSDLYGCERTMDFVIPESPYDCINIPTSFTPNGDGTNDNWVIRNIDLYPGHFVKIYNRWGNLLYEAAPYNEPWNGNYNGKPLPSETYYFVIDLNNDREPFTGTVTIIR